MFYRTPSEHAVSGWVRQTPDKIVFAWKASKFITHWKRLKETSRNSLDLMESRLKLLGAKAGLAWTRFRRHRVRCFDGAGGASWRDGSLPVSSSLRLFG